MTDATHYQPDDFIVCQAQDGTWDYYHRTLDSPERPDDGGFQTKEQAEREAARLAYRLQKGHETEQQIKERMMPLIKAWAEQTVRETGLELQEVLLDIGDGVKQAVKELCPAG